MTRNPATDSDDRFGGLDYDELLDEDGNPVTPIDLDDIIATFQVRNAAAARNAPAKK